jgi:hypothetical protein
VRRVHTSVRIRGSSINQMRPRYRAITTIVIVSSAAIALTLPAVAHAAMKRGVASTMARHRAATATVHVRPTDKNGHRLARYRVSERHDNAECLGGSEAVVGAFRCFAGNVVYDPCWMQHSASVAVLCPLSPWSHKVVRLRISQLDSYPEDRNGNFPWGIRLANGYHCVAAQGTHDRFHGRVVDYVCSHRVALLRPINRRHKSWTVHTIVYNKDFSRQRRGPIRHIRQAIVGKKSWQPSHT